VNVLVPFAMLGDGEKFLEAGLDDYLGMGLVARRQFIVQHGGHIWAESSPGKGTTVFFFTLPASV
jgi:light-regulated signal transduction histidine kinase (bacteriophytochrome)